MKKKIISAGLAVILIISMVACGKADDNTSSKTDIQLEQSKENEAHSETEERKEIAGIVDFKVTSTDFAIELFKACYSPDENVIISPLSVQAALSMTANGADGETLSQMEQILANGADIEALNKDLSTYINGLPSSEDAKVSIGNSIWFLDDKKVNVNPDFLNKNNETYKAEIYKGAFDEKTLKDINNWVDNKTDGMISSILDRLPEDAIMYLINAVALDAKWENQYHDYEVQEEPFTTEDGVESQVQMMHSEENRYIEDKLATGFCKPYKEGYTFVALLPNEGVTVEEYINSLNAEEFRKMLEDEQDIKVYATLPKFTSKYQIEMKDILQTAGMTDAFDSEKADFTRLGTSDEGNIFISRVLHKTYITVDENGTKAGAVTAVEMMCESAMMEEDYRKVVLDRPFCYAIIDNEMLFSTLNDAPFFTLNGVDIA